MAIFLSPSFKEGVDCEHCEQDGVILLALRATTTPPVFTGPPLRPRRGLFHLLR